MINLKELAKKHYLRVTREGGEKDDMLFGQPEYNQLRVPCEYGTIFVGYAGGLRAFSDSPRILHQLGEIPDTEVTHTRWEANGQVSELTISFPTEILPAVATLLRARRTRKLSERQLANLARYRKSFPSTSPKTPFATGEAENGKGSHLSG